jgi:hypothetical protein
MTPKIESIKVEMSELVEAKRLIHEALTPKVSFNGDVEAMRKEADQNRNTSLSLLLGWICKYVHE